MDGCHAIGQILSANDDQSIALAFITVSNYSETVVVRGRNTMTAALDDLWVDSAVFTCWRVAGLDCCGWLTETTVEYNAVLSGAWNETVVGDDLRNILLYNRQFALNNSHSINDWKNVGFLKVNISIKGQPYV